MPPSEKLVDQIDEGPALQENRMDVKEPVPTQNVTMNGAESKKGNLSSETKVLSGDEELSTIAVSSIPLLVGVMFVPLICTSSMVSSVFGAVAFPRVDLSLYVASGIMIFMLSNLVPSEAMVYRHIFWRIILAVIIWYNVLLTILYLYPNRESARDEVFAIFFRDIGSLSVYQQNTIEAISHVMKSCAINATTLYRQLFVAPWFACHAAGWTVKMFVFRDVRMCLVAATMFEIWEVSLGYVVPEFEECWWDSLFLDSLIGNMLGIVIGNSLLKSLGMEMYNWSGCQLRQSQEEQKRQQQQQPLTAQRNHNNAPSFPLSRFSPFTSRYTYEMFYNPTRFFQYMITPLMMCVTELNIFNLVNTMGTPHGSNYCAFRMLFVGALALPAGCEWYRYVQGKTNGIGRCCFALLWMNMVELMVTYKFFPPHMRMALDNVNNPFNMPYEVVASHAISSVLFLVWFILRFKVVGYDNIQMDVEETKIVNAILSQRQKSNGQKSREQTDFSFFECWLNFRQLPPKLQQRVAILEGIDGLLFIALVPQCYLLHYGWKWD